MCGGRAYMPHVTEMIGLLQFLNGSIQMVSRTALSGFSRLSMCQGRLGVLKQYRCLTGPAMSRRRMGMFQRGGGMLFGKNRRA